MRKTQDFITTAHVMIKFWVFFTIANILESNYNETHILQMSKYKHYKIMTYNNAVKRSNVLYLVN